MSERGEPFDSPSNAEPDPLPLVVWTSGAPLPAFADLDGQEVAIVEANDYRALAALRERLSGGERTAGEAGVVALGSDDAPVRAAFPMRVSVLGVAAVVISAEEHARLLTAHDRSGRREVVRLSKLDQDAEVREFIDAQLGSRDVEAIRHAAQRQFGSKRAPSRSALNRYAKRRRQTQAGGGM